VLDHLHRESIANHNKFTAKLSLENLKKLEAQSHSHIFEQIDLSKDHLPQVLKKSEDRHQMGEKFPFLSIKNQAKHFFDPEESKRSHRSRSRSRGSSNRSTDSKTKSRSRAHKSHREDEERGHRSYSISELFQVDRIYRGKVTSIKDFGVFAKIYSHIDERHSKEGLIHVSQLRPSKYSKEKPQRMESAKDAGH
jgi:polyribonucleotide nucleotidyltransferase